MKPVASGATGPTVRDRHGTSGVGEKAATALNGGGGSAEKVTDKSDGTCVNVVNEVLNGLVLFGSAGRSRGRRTEVFVGGGENSSVGVFTFYESGFKVEDAT